MRKRLLILVLCVLGFVLMGCTESKPTEMNEDPRDASSIMDELAEKIVEVFE